MNRIFGRFLMGVFLLLIVGCASAPTATPTATRLPPTVAPTSELSAARPTITLTRTPLPTLTPKNGQPAATNAPLSLTATSTTATIAPASLAPSATSALLAAASPNIDAMLRATFIPTSAAGAPGIPPPLTIKLPADWKSTYTLVPLRDQLSEVTMNVAAYAGPIADKGTGFIFILWNFPSITPISGGTAPKTSEELRRQMVLSDGFRLLRGTVVDATCEVGVYPDAFNVAGTAVTGQRFQTANCQDGSPDNAGWYVGLFPGDRELLIYTYVEPVSAYNNGRGDLQRILDTITLSAAQSVSTATTPLPAATIATSAPKMVPTTTPVLN